MFFNSEEYRVEVGSKTKYFSDRQKAMEYFEKNKYGDKSVFLYELENGTYVPKESYVAERTIIFNKFVG